MMRQLLTALAVLCFLSGAAGAQESGEGAEGPAGKGPQKAFDENFDKGIYVELRVGKAWLEQADIEYLGADGEAKFNAGWVIGGALGYAHEVGLRFEFEGLHSKIVNDDLDLPGGQQNLAGQITAITTMFNVYYDFNLRNPEAENTVAARLKPFVGAGLGLAILDFEGTVAGVGTIDGIDHVLAYQFMLGLGFWITPHVSVNLRYAILGTDDPTFQDAAGDEFKAEQNVTHSILAGVRYRF